MTTDNKAPRVWTCDEIWRDYCLSDKVLPKGLVEKSAYDKLQAELDEARVMFEDVKSELKLLYSDRTKLESRLEKCEALLAESGKSWCQSDEQLDAIIKYFAEVEGEFN